MHSTRQTLYGPPNGATRGSFFGVAVDKYTDTVWVTGSAQGSSLVSTWRTPTMQLRLTKATVYDCDSLTLASLTGGCFRFSRGKSSRPEPGI